MRGGSRHSEIKPLSIIKSHLSIIFKYILPTSRIYKSYSSHIVLQRKVKVKVSDALGLIIRLQFLRVIYNKLIQVYNFATNQFQPLSYHSWTLLWISPGFLKEHLCSRIETNVYLAGVPVESILLDR